MPPYKAPTYPKELTDKWWQSNNGLIAKVATKDTGTGIGKQLTTLQAGFARLDWSVLDPERWPGYAGTRTAEDLKQGMASCAGLAKNTEPLYRLARQIEVDAKKLADTWQRDRMIPKSAVAAATAVSKQANVLSYVLSPATISDQAKQAKAACEQAKRENDEKLRKILSGLPAMLAKIQSDCDKGVSLEKWPGFWKQDVRAIGTMLPSLTKLKPAAVPVAKTFQKHSNKCNSVTEQQQLNGWLVEIKNSARRLEQYV